MRWSRRLITRALRERFVVTTVDGATFAGVLVDVDDRHYVLADASQLTAAGERVPADGHLWIPAATVAYLQRPEV